ncbi:MAG: hypothetical protein QOH67_4266 [Hyphomicrobiales bacterium]|jgi:hypothetical protein|nr:hypothetical protein [Hyphomicrobiales bacterium]
MKTHSVIGAAVIFVLGGLVGHVITLPTTVSAEARPAQISTYELTQKAGHLPVQTADAI